MGIDDYPLRAYYFGYEDQGTQPRDLERDEERQGLDGTGREREGGEGKSPGDVDAVRRGVPGKPGPLNARACRQTRGIDGRQSPPYNEGRGNRCEP